MISYDAFNDIGYKYSIFYMFYIFVLDIQYVSHYVFFIYLQSIAFFLDACPSRLLSLLAFVFFFLVLSIAILIVRDTLSFAKIAQRRSSET